MRFGKRQTSCSRFTRVQLSGPMGAQEARSPDASAATARTTLEARLASLRRRRFALRCEIEGTGPATGDLVPILARKRRRLSALNRQIALIEVELLSL